LHPLLSNAHANYTQTLLRVGLFPVTGARLELYRLARAVFALDLDDVVPAVPADCRLFWLVNEHWGFTRHQLHQHRRRNGNAQETLDVTLVRRAHVKGALLLV